jgi:arylsulfatase A-like enzyme
MRCGARALFLLLLLHLVPGLFLFATFGYVNDWRVTPFAIESLSPPQTALQRLGSLLPATSSAKGWPHDVSVPSTSAKALLKEHRDLFETLLVDSARFHSPWQVFATLGSYPERLVGHDALVIPAKATLKFFPGASGELQLEFFSASNANSSRLALTASEQSRELPTGRITAPRKDSWWTRNVTRFLFVDAPPPGGFWQHHRESLHLNPNAAISIRCEAEEGAFCLVSPPTLYQTAPSSRPNFLVIVTDSLRHDAITPRAAPRLSSELESLTRFTRAFTPGNMTSPSTTGFLSGRWAFQTPELAFSYFVGEETRNRYYEKSPGTWPRLLQQEGYDTAMIGAISLFSEVLGAGVNFGFEDQIATETEGYETPHLSREAAGWLAEHKDRPFLLYLNFNAPHAPYRAPLRDMVATFPGLSALTSQPTVLRWLYSAEVHYSDRYIASLLDALQRLGLDQNTHVIFTGDHGCHSLSRLFTGNQAGPPHEGAFFDHGSTLLNQEVMVPLLWRSPRQTQAQNIGDTVSLVDLAPTILSQAGITPPSWLSGSPLLFLSGSRPTILPTTRTLGIEGFREQAIVFDNRYKYIKAYRPTRKRLYSDGDWFSRFEEVFVPEQLYDLLASADEEVNLITQDEGLTQRARELYRRHYGMTIASELTIETPDRDAWVARVPGTPDSDDLKAQGISETREKSFSHLSGSGKQRWTFRIYGVTDSTLPSLSVSIAGTSIPTRLTSSRLPIRVPLNTLPVEEFGVSSLPELTYKSVAFLRQVESSKTKERKIEPLNAEFEKILKDWGYLNEN